MKHQKSRKKSTKEVISSKKKEELGIINPNAAGIDISSAEHYVAVPFGRSEKNVRVFGAFTRDMHEMAKWLMECKIDTVAMESTGIFWIQLYLVLEEYGFDVYLVNPRHVKNVTGRKSDLSDCQWIQQLHSYGLLKKSFQPDIVTRELRNYLRHRKNLIEGLSKEILHLQNSFEEMNIKIHTVINDITGKSGIKIIEAILSGQRDAKDLSKLADGRIKAAKEEIEKSLEGNYRNDSLFSLRQAYELYKIYQKMISECDKEIENVLKKASEVSEIKNHKSIKPVKEIRAVEIKKQKHKNAPGFDVRKYLIGILGVDPMAIWGINELNALTIVSETGVDMNKWATEKHFTSWLGIAPNNKISGGRVISSKIEKKKNHAGQAFRLAASSLYKSQNSLGDFYRRIRARSGPAKANVATARKLAVIYYKMVKYNQEFNPIDLDQYREIYKDKKVKYLQKQLSQFGLKAVAA